MRTPNVRDHRTLKNHVSIVLLAALLAVSHVPVVQAQSASQAQAPQPGLGWRQAVDAAVERSGISGLVSARDTETAALNRVAAQSFAGPIESDGALRQDAIGSNFGYVEAEVGVSAPLWRRGERALLQARAASGGRVAKLAQDVLALEIAGDVRTAWWAYANARAVASVDREQARLAGQTVDQVKRLVDGGELARLDLRQAEIAAATAQQEASLADNQVELARLALEALIGPNAGDLPTEAQGPETGEHPRLALANAEAEQLRGKQRLASISATPRWRVGLDLRAERGLRGEDLGVSTGVRASVPLGPDYAVRAEAATVGLDLAQKEVAARRDAIAIQVAISQARAALAGARAQNSQAQAAFVAASDALALTQRGRAEGQLSFIEELRARAVLADAARAQASAGIAVSAAISTLNQALGLRP